MLCWIPLTPHSTHLNRLPFVKKYCSQFFLLPLILSPYPAPDTMIRILLDDEHWSPGGLPFWQWSCSNTGRYKTYERGGDSKERRQKGGCCKRSHRDISTWSIKGFQDSLRRKSLFELGGFQVFIMSRHVSHEPGGGNFML